MNDHVVPNMIFYEILIERIWNRQLPASTRYEGRKLWMPSAVTTHTHTHTFHSSVRRDNHRKFMRKLEPNMCDFWWDFKTNRANRNEPKVILFDTRSRRHCRVWQGRDAGKVFRLTLGLNCSSLSIQFTVRIILAGTHWEEITRLCNTPMSTGIWMCECWKDGLGWGRENTERSLLNTTTIECFRSYFLVEYFTRIWHLTVFAEFLMKRWSWPLERRVKDGNHVIFEQMNI